ADAVRSITYQEMIRLYRAGELKKEHMDCFIEPRSPEELFDVLKDPFQTVNLAHDPDHEVVLTEMRNLLDSWIEETNDSVPQNPTPDKFNRWTGSQLNE
ncbi:MAG: hypothetical protein ACOC0R_02380, partial [Mariniphaga sp.]